MKVDEITKRVAAMFDNDDGFIEEPENNYRCKLFNRTGEKVNSWLIKEMVDEEKYTYKVQCDCGKIYIRRIYFILSNRSTCCFICRKKNKRLNHVWKSPGQRPTRVNL